MDKIHLGYAQMKMNNLSQNLVFHDYVICFVYYLTIMKSINEISKFQFPRCFEQSYTSHLDDSADGWGVTDWYQSRGCRELGRTAMFDLVYS